MQQGFSKYLELIGHSFIYYWFILLTITTVGFILGSGILVFYTYLAVLFLYFYLYFITKNFIYPIFIILGLSLLITFSIYLSLHLWDFSWDGRTYHSVAVHALSEGWNPYYTKDLTQFANYKHGVWVESYPKSNWIFIANNLQLLNNIDAAKFINYCLVLCTALVLFRFLKGIIANIIIRILIIITLVLNPIVVGQINTLYLDGNLYLLMLLFSISLVNYYSKRSKENFILTTMITVILINLKFTSLLFIAIGFILFITASYWQSKKIPLAILLKGVSVFVLAIVVYGYSPYINNYLKHGNAFHPIYGEKKINILKSQMNPDFLKLNRLKQFYYSTNSIPSNDLKAFPTLANPIKTGLDIENYKRNNHDLRINGYGPLFIISLYLTLLGLIYSFYRKNKPDKIFYMAVSFIIMSLLVPSMWWARLVPLLWAAPLFFGIYFIANKSIVLRFLSTFITLILLINTSLLGYFTIHKNLEHSQFLDSIMMQVKANKIFVSFKTPLAISGKKSITHKLDSYGVDYKILNKKRCKTVGWFYDADICEPR